MKAFVTGGSGFIGRNLIKLLIQRDYEVIALSRSQTSSASLLSLGAQVAQGDITHKASMRKGMAGCDIVFHLAAWYQIGGDNSSAHAINVDGTRNVLSLAHELGIPKIVYTSTVAIFGNTDGDVPTEEDITIPRFREQSQFPTAYHQTKWMAHYKVALPLLHAGAPIIFALPGGVYGPGDTSLIVDTMEQFFAGMTFSSGSDTLGTYAHVEDIAEGHLLIAEKGAIGEAYILAGDAIKLSDLIALWADLTGRKKPRYELDSRLVRQLIPVLDSAEKLIPIPPLMSAEALRTVGHTYLADSTKARTELGWKTRSLQSGMLETLRWVEMRRASGENQPSPQRVALSGAALVAGIWALRRIFIKQ